MVYFVIKDPLFHYKELGETRIISVERERNKAVNKLKSLGFSVDLKEIIKQ